MTTPRNANENLQDRITFPFDHVTAAADATWKIWKLPRPFRVERVMYVNPTGLAVDENNYFIIKLLKGATVAASWSTKTTGGAAIPVDTFIELALSATDADAVFDTDDVMSFFADEQGNTSLPAGRLVVEGRYL